MSTHCTKCVKIEWNELSNCTNGKDKILNIGILEYKWITDLANIRYTSTIQIECIGNKWK